jgi:uncharacterized protein GlcG (DUF336 family)
VILNRFTICAALAVASSQLHAPSGPALTLDKKVLTLADFEEQIRDGRVAALALADATPLQGGVLVLIGGRVVGAVGVSGDSPQVDEEIAIAGMGAISTGK